MQYGHNGRTVFISMVSMLMFNVLVWHGLGLATFPGNDWLNSFFWLGEVLYYSYWFIGIAQFLYVVPLCFWLIDCRRFAVSRFAVIKGILVGALLTVLLNGWLLANFPAHIGIG